MKNILKTIFLFIILTILTQVGGVIYVFIKYVQGEYDYPKVCADCSNDFKHNYLRKITPQFQKIKFKFDAVRTQRFLELCVQNNLIKRIYLEPHLQTRLGFDSSNKIHRTGCNAVRHDDHIHIQL